MQERALPGLERLMDVCRKNNIVMDIEPPGRHPPRAGEMVGGLPFGPVLALVYARSRRMSFGGELDGIFLYQADDVDDMDEQSEEVRWGWPEIFKTSLFVFAGEPALAYYFATVPVLADEKGMQPVVRIDGYEDLYALPIASSVDRFFDTYSRSLERQVELVRSEAESKARLEAKLGPRFQDSLSSLFYEHPPRINFPWEVPDLIARDEPLVKMLRAGRFDFLMESCAEAREWVGKVLAAST